MPERRIMIVAGEASGDAHAAKLVRALGAEKPGDTISFFGAAGESMRAAGVEPIVTCDDLSVVGLAEIAVALPRFLNALKRLKAAARERRPDVAVLVDFPDFNLKLARSLKKIGIPVVYYISPQLWAWRQYRIRSIDRYVDLLLTILPFEKAWFAERGVTHVEYVGNPSAGEVYPRVQKAEFCEANDIDPDRPIIALLPGSREREVARIFPVMLDAAKLLLETDPQIQFAAAAASARSATKLTEAGAAAGLADAVRVVDRQTYDALNASDAAAITSGTATLEAGILGTPMVIVYKTSAINYGLLEPLISVDHYGLVNLIAGKRLATELIQGDLTPERLAADLTHLLDADANRRFRDELRLVRETLGSGGASKRAAGLIAKLISREE